MPSRHPNHDRRSRWYALAGAAMVHVLLFAALAWWAYGTGGFDRPERGLGGAGGSSAEADDAAAVGPREADDPAEVQRLIDAQTARISRMSPDEQLAELRGRADYVERLPQANVQAAARVVEAVIAGPAPDRQMAPVAGASGEFDPDTASLYDIVKRRDAQGRVVYDQILVDSAGRTLTHTIPESQMSPQDLRTFSIFEMARQNPNLRALVDTVRRVAEQRMPAMPAE
jgi:hypothetical protein